MRHLRRLDECLQGINDNNDYHRGLIEKLTKSNSRTTSSARGSERLYGYNLDFAFAVDFTKGGVHVQALERPEVAPIKLHFVLDYPDSTSWKAIVPLQYLLKGWGDANAGYQGYTHIISPNVPRTGTFAELHNRQQQDDSYYYVGITGRNWLQRLSEHMSEIRRGSRRKFYEAWRNSIGIQDVLFTSTLVDVNLTYEDAMAWEEDYVDKVAYGPRGLNMIPGGFKGLKYLHEHRITGRVDISLEERERAIDEYVRQNPRKGIPNPYISELWKDDAYYLRNIESRPKTLSPGQVRRIRELHALGWSIEKITEEVGALNDTQVKNVISGKTYARVR